MKYTIQAVSDNVREYDTKYGAMKSYKVMFQGETDPVEISQKSDTDAPVVGQELEGTINETQYGRKFKKEYQQSFGGFGKRVEDPAKQDSIMKMNALNNAVALTASRKEWDASYVTKLAEALYGWLKDDEVGRVESSAVETSQPSGYEQLKEKFGKKEEEKGDEPPVELYENLDEINFDDIPF